MFILYQCSTDHRAIKHISNGIQIETKGLNVNVRFYSDNIVRIVKWLPGSSPEKLSLSVIQDSLPELDLDIRRKSGYISISSDKLILRIAKNEGRIEFFNKDKEIILNEYGRPVFTPVEFEGDKSFNVQQKFRLTPDEGIYGLGQHQDGYMNYRGCTVNLVQANTDAVNPFLISTRKYGILWDNYSRTVFRDDPETSLWSEMGDNIDYYFIYGSTMDDVIAGYRNLTGQAPMYGKWAYGYWQSKEHYEDRNELLGVVEEYRKRKIPVDNIIQDWDYWEGRENWSQMFFDPKKFPKPEEMIRKIHDLNFHIMISIWPGLGPNTLIYKDMEERGFLFNTSGWAGFK